MVRNESAILERCLKAVEGTVDAFCIHDTGSTDNTKEIARTFLESHKGCLTESTWQNFGHNRTLSFRAAQDYVVHREGWKDVYGLLLDADMVFEPGTLLEQPLTEKGYTMVQINGTLEYPNCRLIRMDYPWVCAGVTHEYWDGPTVPLSKSICRINDQNDGGCKSDKFTRDVLLLEEGLQKDPTNIRYMFYLAQSYHCLGRHKEAITMYKKRFKEGGWAEEPWYSLYMIGQTYLTLGDAPSFEKYMLKAYNFRPTRAEPIYKLAKYFREQGQHYKAYHYIHIGKAIPMSTDSLFVETNVYTDLFRYEETICLFYLNQKPEGLRKSMEYLLTRTTNTEGVFSNMVFYIQPIGKDFTVHPVDRTAFGRDFHPSSISSIGDTHMVRFVNYSITDNGGYDMKQGSYSGSNKVRTQNALWTPNSPIVLMKDSSIQLPRRGNSIVGIEDVRIFENSKKQLRFVGTSTEFSEKIGIVMGDIYKDEYRNTIALTSPLNADCEKNWIPVNGTEDVLYSWNPLRVGHVEGNELVIHKEIKTPPFFSHLRGSAIPIQVGNELWCLVHYVHHCTPRKYFHCIVALDPCTYIPSRISVPFVFRAEGIEYCLSIQQIKNEVECIFSSWDDNPVSTRFPICTLDWVQV